MTQVNGASMGNCRNVLASIVLTAALFAPPGIGSAQEQVAPTRDVTRSKVIRTRRLSIPADSFKEEAVRFERARIDMNGSIAADGHNLSLYGVVLLRRDKICTAEEGARWACGQRAFMALRKLLAASIQLIVLPEETGMTRYMPRAPVVPVSSAVNVSAPAAGRSA
jgi:hypothetical protein